MPALRTDDPSDLGLHQLGQHAQPDSDAEREQPHLRLLGELTQRFSNLLGQVLEALLIDRDRGMRYGPQ